MQEELIQECRDVLNKIPLETQLETLADCADDCTNEEDKRIFQDAMAIMLGLATYEDGQVKYLDSSSTPCASAINIAAGAGDEAA